jgi:dipeptidyl aminopeptidase/acylaminoacyl peptidase
MLLIHGQIDDIVPIEQSEIMRDALRRVGREPRLISLPMENHQWNPMTIANRRTTLDEAERFIRQHIGPGVGPSASPMQ